MERDDEATELDAGDLDAPELNEDEERNLDPKAIGEELDADAIGGRAGEEAD